MIKIEKNVPIPLHGKLGLPFDNMEIGDSFFIDNITDCKTAKTIMSRYNKGTSKKFISRSYGAGFRFWRVS